MKRLVKIIDWLFVPLCLVLGICYMVLSRHDPSWVVKATSIAWYVAFVFSLIVQIDKAACKTGR